MLREIISHRGPKANELNRDLLLHADMNTVGAGGACTRYIIDCDNCRHNIHGQITFQSGPVKEAGINGWSNELLLAVVKDRLESFQAGPFSDDDNARALQHVTQALSALHVRTLKRTERGVEGTLNP